MNTSHLLPAVRAYPEAAIASKVVIDTCGSVRESEMQQLRALYLEQQEELRRLRAKITELELLVHNQQNKNLSSL